MGLKSVKVPEPFEPPFAQAEKFVEEHFATLSREPEKGIVRVGGERYVMMRCESLYLGWFDAMAKSFGEEAAREFIYNTAREIGRADSSAFSKKLGLEDGLARLSSGPIHFAHAGWAFVEILADSAPAADDNYFLHYFHPNTFESEVVTKEDRKPDAPVCLFSAGYSAGWCSDAFGVDVHGREVRCAALGHDNCEFIMAPAGKLDEHHARVKESWTS